MAVVPKAKRRNSERRKEHSRDAARSRRSREAEVFLHLAQEIPLPYDSVKVLDKTSIIRLAITYLKLRTLLAEDLSPGNGPPSISSGHLEQKRNQFYHRALDGFLMVVASDGDVLFVTDNIASFLGLTQMDVLGQSIYDLSHPCDHDEIREMISMKSHLSDDSGHHRGDVFVRMKSTITSKGRNVNIKSASYKVISCSGHLKTVRVSLSGGEEETVSFVVIIGQSIGHPLNIEVPLDSRTFVSRHSLDMKFTECGEGIRKLLGYRADDIVGQSMYSYHHALDTETLDKTFRTLFCKGQASTGLYRFLAQHGGFVWIETHATVVTNVATDKPESVVCLNHVVSGVECEDVVFDVVQLSTKMSPPNDVSQAEKCEETEEASEASVVLKVCPDTTYKDDEQDGEQTCMQFVTEKILEQAVKDKDDSNTAMIDRICYLLDPSSEMSSSSHDQSHDQSLYSINGPVLKSQDVKASDMIGCESEGGGMTINFSSSSLSSLLDKMEEGMEMRAPYIPMDDLVFSSSVETPFAQSSYVTDTQLPCLMNSDPLLPSVGREPHDPLASLFTMTHLSESQAPSFHTPPLQKSSGTKRSHCSPEGVIDLTAAPCKVPRLSGPDSTLSLERSSARQAPVSTVNMLTSPVIHVPPLTMNQCGIRKQVTSISTNPEQQVAFFPVANLIGAAPENKRTAAVEVGEPTASPPVIYVMLNGQLTPVTLVTDQQVPTTRCDGVKVQGTQKTMMDGVGVIRTAQGAILQPRDREVQSVADVVRGGDFDGHGNFVLDLTSQGGRTTGMATTGHAPANTGHAPATTGHAPATTGHAPVPRTERATEELTGAMFLGTGNKTLIASKCGPGQDLTANQAMTNLGGQPGAASKPSSAHPTQQQQQQLGAVDRPPPLSTDQWIRLILPSLRKVLRSIPDQVSFEETPEGGGGATQEQYQHTGGDPREVGNSAGRGGTGGTADGEEGLLPLHLKLQGGCMPTKPVLPDFLKALESENEVRVPAKSDGLIGKVSILNGSVPQPLHLLQEGVTAARYLPVESAGCLQVDGGGIGGVRRVIIPPGTASAVVNAGGQQQQQSQRPRAQVIIKSIRQQPAPVLKAIGLRTCTDDSSMSKADASEAGQHLASPCSGSGVDTTGSSVLMNLLMKGVDVNYGYSLQSSRTMLDSQKQLNMG